MLHFTDLDRVIEHAWGFSGNALALSRAAVPRRKLVQRPVIAGQHMLHEVIRLGHSMAASAAVC